LAAGAPICVRQNAAQEGFIKTFYPDLTILPIPGLTQAGLLPAIVSGKCKGGIGPDPELKYSLGGPGIFDEDGFDPSGALRALGLSAHVCAALMLLGRGAASFCKLQTVGGLLTFGYYGVSAIEQHARKRTAVG
jgi:hypothetical protein